MACHQCGKPVEVGQRFCGVCGASLRGITDATEIVPTSEPTGEWSNDDPVWAATGAVPTTPAADVLRTSDLPATEPVATARPTATAWPLDDTPDLVAGPVDPADPVDAVWAVTGEGFQAPSGAMATAEMPATPIGPAVPRQSRLRFTSVSVFGLLMAITALVGSFTVAVGIESDVRLTPTDAMPPSFRTGTWYLDDFADNLSVAVLIAAVLTVVGGVAAAFRWRWGSGLAGGGGLAMAGLGVLSIGLAQFPLQAARDFAATPNSQVFTLTLTRDLGYWLLIASAALGVIVFFAFVERRVRRPAIGAQPVDRRRSVRSARSWPCSARCCRRAPRSSATTGTASTVSVSRRRCC